MAIRRFQARGHGLAWLLALGVVLFCFAQTVAFGQSEEDQADWLGLAGSTGGVWSNPNNWECPGPPCVPGVGSAFNIDFTFIYALGNVAVDTNPSVGYLQIGEGSVTVGSGFTLTTSKGLALQTGGSLIIHGVVINSNNSSNLGTFLAGYGSLTVSGSGSQLDDLSLSGVSLELSTVTVQDGGSISALNEIGVGGGGGTTAVTVTGPGTSLIAGTLSLGMDDVAIINGVETNLPGAGSVTLGAGAAGSSASGLDMGVMSGGNGTMTLTDAGTTWMNSGGQVIVGDAGTGTLTIENGAVLSSATDSAAGGPSGIIGNQANSNGTVQVKTTGEWNDAGSLVIANKGDGSLKIQSGGIVNDASAKIGVADSSSGIVDVTGAGSQWNNLTGQVEVGVAGLGFLSLEGEATGSSGGGLDIGVNHSVYANSMTLTDAGTSWTNRGGQVIVGDAGTGTLTVSSGGAVSDAAGFVGVNSGSKGTLTVSGAGSEWNNSEAVSVGVSGQGTVTVNTGAAGSAGGLLDIGVNTGSTGTMTLTDAGTTWENHDQNVIVGDAGTGTLKIQNGAALSDAGTVTVGNYGTGTLSIGGSPFTSTMGTIGDNAGSFGTVMVKGAGTLWNVETQLTVGDQGMGTLDVTKGGLVGTEVADVGLFGASVGSVTVSGAGSELQANQLVVGYGGQGILTISSGGVVNDGNAEVGGLSGGKGNVTVSGTGSAWKTATMLDIGTSGKGIVTVSSGGVVSAGTLENPGTITIGTEGTVDAMGGTLQGNVINHGTLDPVGTITIEGDYTQGVDGTLILEVAGVGDYGQFDVSGDATFDGTIDLDFIDGFAPSTGDSFDFIRVTGSTDFSGATIGIAGLEPGFEYSDEFTNGDFTLAALNDGISSSPVNGQTPEPGTLLLFATALVVLMACCRLRFLRVGV